MVLPLSLHTCASSLLYARRGLLQQVEQGRLCISAAGGRAIDRLHTHTQCVHVPKHTQGSQMSAKRAAATRGSQKLKRLKRCACQHCRCTIGVLGQRAWPVWADGHMLVSRLQRTVLDEVGCVWESQLGRANLGLEVLCRSEAGIPGLWACLGNAGACMQAAYAQRCGHR